MSQWSAAQIYPVMKQKLNERDRRLYFATEALKIGHGGISQVQKLSGVSRVTITRGVMELQQNSMEKDRIRHIGGGRKKATVKYPQLKQELSLLTHAKGDPMKRLLWTTKSIVKLAEELHKKQYILHPVTIMHILHQMGYSLKPNKKNIEGTSHIDRDAQFLHINKQCDLFEKNNNPIISIDCKKKEKLGNFKNNGKEWTGKGKVDEVQVNAYDFTSLAKGNVAPYGIYDVLKKKGFINVGIDHDTAAFAVESIRRWWKAYGKSLYPKATGILITADGGGSNGVRNKLFKRELQNLTNEINLPVTVCHYPPATSKWNVIEHQLFSFISINWRAKPLTSLAVVLELINHTTTKSGLTVAAVADTNMYPTKIKVTDHEMEQLNIQRENFHGEWNYAIAPQMTSSS